jgi:hypothetical protein
MTVSGVSPIYVGIYQFFIVAMILAGIKVPTIRYYEQVGLLHPRRSGGRRTFEPTEVRRLIFIRRARRRSPQGGKPRCRTDGITLSGKERPFRRDRCPWPIVVNLLCGSLFGAWLGAEWATRLKSESLYRVIAVLLVAIAAVLLFAPTRRPQVRRCSPDGCYSRPVLSPAS